MERFNRIRRKGRGRVQGQTPPPSDAAGESRGLDSQGENLDGDNHSSLGDNNRSRQHRAALRAPAKKAILNVVIATSIGIILLILAIILVQIRTQNEVIKEQTDINQRFIRCLILIPGDRDRTPEERIEAIDRCAIESRLPSGKQTSPSPTNQDREDFENQSPNNQSSSSPKAQAPVEGPPMKPNPTPPNKPDKPVPESPSQPPLSSIVNPVRNLLNNVLDCLGRRCV